jgi:uncharacterized Tic20 family protein
MTENQTTQEDRVVAALTHSSVILFGMGIIVAIVIWATQKDRSRYVGFQSLQSAIYQMAGMIAFLGSMCCWGVLYFLSFIPLMVAAEQGASDPPLFFLFSMMLMFVPFAIMGLWILGGLWAAVRTLQGREFHFLFIGGRLERWLAA